MYRMLSRNYTTSKKKAVSTQRMQLSKFCPRCNKKTLHKESSEDYLHPENFLIRTEFFDEIDKILKSLSSFDKQVFKLYMDGLSIGEIAKRYSKSKKTIYNSLSHIKEKIKKHKRSGL